MLCRFIVTPNVPEDVLPTVQFAADYGLKVQALGTGHQLSGVALAECGVTINMKNLEKIEYDPKTFLVTVQASAFSCHKHRGYLMQLGYGRVFREARSSERSP